MHYPVPPRMVAASQIRHVHPQYEFMPSAQKALANSIAATNMSMGPASRKVNNIGHISPQTTVSTSGHQNRINQNTIHNQSMHSIHQMQKIRQQLQHSNNTNTSIANKAISNHHQTHSSHQPHFQHVNPNAVHHEQCGGSQYHHVATALHRPQQIPLQTPPATSFHHMSPQINNLMHPVHKIPNNILKHTSNVQMLPIQQNPTKQNFHHHHGGNKNKFNNNKNKSNNKNANIIQSNNTSNSAVILQNPHRMNTRQHKVVSTLVEKDSETVNDNEAIIDSLPPVNSISIISTSVSIETTKMQMTAPDSGTSSPTNDDPAINDDSNKENHQPMECKDNRKSSSPSSCDVGSVLSNEGGSSKNSNEKTPMCLVNELARFNKITHQYRLISENGPAHCKRFAVTLKLGDEEYFAEGFKIKKAQHIAAAEAIEKTKYNHPVPKIIRRAEDGLSSRTNLTPTVELNALAMKLGQQTYYLFDPQETPPNETMLLANGQMSDGMLSPYGLTPLPSPYNPHIVPPPHIHMLDHHIRRTNNNFVNSLTVTNINHRFGGLRGFAPKYNAGYAMVPSQSSIPHNVLTPPVSSTHSHNAYGLLQKSCKITLIVGKQKFIGIGRTLQQAKHDAAARALQTLKLHAANQLNEILNNTLKDAESKSPISLVHEIGNKRNMPVHFKVLREDGPAHMKIFITACVVGTIVTEGEGNGKKISKKRAAERMMEELKKLPPLTPTKSPIKRIKMKTPPKTAINEGVEKTTNGSERRKRSNTSIKEKASLELEYESPVTKLIQMQRNRKEKEPVFDLIAKNGNENSRRREFVVEVSACGLVARGTGNSKKLAKRKAAKSLLLAMGVDHNSDVKKDTIQSSSGDNVEGISPLHIATGAVEDAELQTKSTIKTDNVSEADESTPSIGRIPGMLILRPNKKHKHDAVKKKDLLLNQTIRDKINCNQPIAENCSKANDVKDTTTSTTTNSNIDVHKKDHLLYLAKLLGFEVQFSDYPKGSHNDYLTIVTLSTDPPQICHGIGPNSEDSRNDAANNALKILSELGLNNIKN